MSNLTLSKRVTSLAPSATVMMAQKARVMKKSGIDVIAMTAGEPDFHTPEPIVEAAKRALDEKSVFKYTAIKGIDALVDAMLHKFKRDQGIDYTPNEVMSTVGGKAALAFALDAMLDEGDEVIIFSPYWVSYPAQVQLAGGKSVFVTADASTGYVPTIEAFKAAITSRTKAVMLNSPNNPTGAVFPESYLRQVMQVLEGTGIWMISDEIYEHLTFDGHKHVSPASFSADAKSRTLVVSGVAKSYAMTGWRIGTVAGPEALIAGMCKVQGQRYTCATAVAQAAAAYALMEPPELKPILAEMKKAYEHRRDVLASEVAKHEQFKLFKAQGAFYALLDVSKICGNDDIGFSNRLLEEAHVAVVPGTPFGAPGTIRLSLASSLEDILEGFSRLIQMVEK